jgi:hypothetical protein
MNYLKHYERLIERARIRVLDSYTESHHIIPRCVGGTNDLENIVELTPEEHFLAHQLLVKIYPLLPELVMAVRYMCYGNIKNGKRTNNKMFGWLRRRHAEAMREINTGRKQSPETIEKRFAHRRGKPGKPLTEESIRKRTETRKLRESGKHRSPRSEETKQKLSKANKGKISKNKGTKHSDENKQKIKDALAKLLPLICPNCSKSGKSSVMYRWHFDNCRNYS